jgi:hypothetical protein
MMVVNSGAITVEERRQVAKLYYDMYEGDGKENPSVTTRLDRVERTIASVNRLTWSLIGLALAEIANIVSQHLK